MEENETISTIKLITSKPGAGNVMTFVFETGGLSWVAGQYQKYILPQAGITKAETERWFTIASAPSENVMHLSARISPSTFKQALKALVPGETIQRRSLKGDFIWEEESSKPVVLIAGGIGITPFRSILLERQATNKKINATLLYFNRTNEIPFLEEFEAFAEKHSEFTLLPIVGESIGAQNILSRVPQVTDQTFYLAGPKSMIESIGDDLKKQGINLKQDWFSGYDEKNY
ncbi:MAG: FAD-dependent oxidoreductase [bacterium]|nr:FAD-dependent oxidoreductase [bacterium]